MYLGSESNRRVMRQYPDKRNPMKTFFVISASVSLVIALMMGGCRAALEASKQSETVTLESKERVNGSSSSKYLFWVEESETTYSVGDSILYWRWDSSDAYGKLKEGEQYEITTIGWRVPFLSWYRNAIEIERATSGATDPKE